MSKAFEEIKEGLEQAIALEKGYLPEYKGYKGTVEYTKEDGVFFGKVVGIRSLVSYEGATLKELEENFRDVVDEFIEDCKDINISEVEKPLSDSLVGVLSKDCIEKKRRLVTIEKLFESYEGDYVSTEFDWGAPDESNDLKKEADIGWIIDEDGVGHCPYCQSTTLEDEYTGKPILFKYCPECGKFLNGPGR